MRFAFFALLASVLALISGAMGSAIPRQAGAPSCKAAKDCHEIINCYRKADGRPAIKKATSEQRECAKRCSEYDARYGYHASHYRRMCPGVGSQNQCMRGVRGMDGSTGLHGCVRAYYDEKFTGAQGRAHYNIMMGNWKSVACGTDGNGFYTMNFYA